jgi:outer membrane receptor protein involved in Fe transport
LRASGGLTWTRGAVSLTWQAQYYHHYIISTNATFVALQGRDGYVPSQVYHDAAATYSFGSGAGWLADTQLRLGIQNVFNKRPPVDMNFTYMMYSVFGDPRLASYTLSLRHSF